MQHAVRTHAPSSPPAPAVYNNVIHHIGLTALRAVGSYDALLAYNTVYRVPNLLEVVQGDRGCAGDDTAHNTCPGLYAAGG